jgi:DNA-binding SARP family transcriptional activator
MLRVSLLGGHAITDDATGSVRMHSSRAVALVAFLAVHAGSPQARQRIAGEFWPDSTEARALTNLRRELHHLRHVLENEPALVVTSKDLCWRDTDTCRVDMRIFDVEHQAAVAAAAANDGEGVLRHAAMAIAQYRGDLLPGGYDDWLLAARSEVERQCVDLCDLLGQTRARMGDLAGAVVAARRRIQLQPLEEVGYRALMQLQADLGDRAGAVSTYHHCASVLERELGVIPDPATRQAFQRLMAHADTERAPRPAIEPAAPGSPQLSLSAGPANLACFRTGGGPPLRAGLDWCWSAAVPASGRPAWSPRSRGWPGSKARWWRAASASAARAAGPGAGGGLGAKPGGPGSHGDARRGLARRSRPAGAV